MSALAKPIPLQLITDERGNMVVADAGAVPFPIRRAFWMYDLRGSRGAHAHHATEELAICLRGSCTFVLDNGRDKARHRLDNPTTGLLLEKMVWREMHDFSEDCLLIVFASAPYDEADYIRDYDEFKALATGAAG